MYSANAMTNVQPTRRTSPCLPEKQMHDSSSVAGQMAQMRSIQSSWPKPLHELQNSHMAKLHLCLPICNSGPDPNLRQCTIKLLLMCKNAVPS